MNPFTNKQIIKAGLLQLMLFAFSFAAFSQNRPPVYSPNVSNIESLKKIVEPLMKMSVEEVIAQVPHGSGIYFVGCPNCNGGAQEGGVLGWKLGMGNKVQCNYCQMVFPNEKFPNNREKVIIAPSGTKQVYRYYQNPEGREYHFETHAWYERWTWINPMAERLAAIWYATKDNAYGDRAAAIAGRFAQLFPDYAIRYDYPNQPKKFFPANQKWPYEGLSPYRGAKWRWWGYDDIPVDLTTAYDLLNSGYDWKRMDKLIGPETDKRIVRDLLRLGYEFVTANPEPYGNKSPGMWSQMIRVGRVLGEPAMVHEAVNRFREFLSRSFFADGWWLEGTTAYHAMTMNGLKAVTDALSGYTDPIGWKGERFENMDPTQGLPIYQKALLVNQEAFLPNGRWLPINDTEPYYGIKEKSERTVSRLWPSLGNAALGTGEGDNQTMLNLNWSGNYGHEHYDNGAIILYAAGQELLPDLGYTHSKYRSWANSTASHNTVVIDQRSQERGSAEKPVAGNLNFYDDKDTHIKVIDVDASPAYSAAKTYRRRLLLVHAGPGRDYVVDRFDVEGGNDHDWFLHGMAEQEGTLETSIPLDRPTASLIPSWGGNILPKTQYETDPAKHHPYQFLRDLKTGATAQKSWTATWRYDAGVGLRVHNLSPAGVQVFRFRTPSIRLAGEDDNKLDNFMHSGIMQRNSGKASSFLSVHEPFRNETWIESVQQHGNTLVVRYKLNGIEIQDRITINEGQITANSSAGWNYNSGTARSGKVEGLHVTGGKYRLQLDKEAPKVNYIRLDLADGGTRYYPVSLVQGKVLELPDDPGFKMGADGKVVFHTFPKDQHAGPLNYTLFVP